MPERRRTRCTHLAPEHHDDRRPGGHRYRRPPDGANHPSNSDDVLSWTSLPARITIVGGGYVSCEFAAILAALGSDATLVHDGGRIFDTCPTALADQVQRNLRLGSVNLHLGPGLAAVTRSDTALDTTP